MATLPVSTKVQAIYYQPGPALSPSEKKDFLNKFAQEIFKTQTVERQKQCEEFIGQPIDEKLVNHCSSYATSSVASVFCSVLNPLAIIPAVFLGCCACVKNQTFHNRSERAIELARFLKDNPKGNIEGFTFAYNLAYGVIR